MTKNGKISAEDEALIQRLPVYEVRRELEQAKKTVARLQPIRLEQIQIMQKYGLEDPTAYDLEFDDAWPHATRR
jgi:hypothetical protein